MQVARVFQDMQEVVTWPRLGVPVEPPGDVSVSVGLPLPSRHPHLAPSLSLSAAETF